MFIEERHNEILTILERNNRISVTDIVKGFGVSSDTARRDLRILENEGLIQRTYGGGIIINKKGEYPPEDYNPSKICNAKENYMQIAKKAISMIKENEVIFITSGSVGYFMVKNFTDNFNFTVVTNSIVIANELLKYKKIECILLGGEMSQQGHFSDYFAIEIAKQINIDKSFITAAGLSTKVGATIQKSAGVALDKVIMDRSTINIGLFPHEKIGKESILTICSAESFDIIITDNKTVREDIDRFEDMGINVEVVEYKNNE